VLINRAGQATKKTAELIARDEERNWGGGAHEQKEAEGVLNMRSYDLVANRME